MNWAIQIVHIIDNLFLKRFSSFVYIDIFNSSSNICLHFSIYSNIVLWNSIYLKFSLWLMSLYPIFSNSFIEGTLSSFILAIILSFLYWPFANISTAFKASFEYPFPLCYFNAIMMFISASLGSIHSEKNKFMSPIICPSFVKIIKVYFV